MASKSGTNSPFRASARLHRLRKTHALQVLAFSVATRSLSVADSTAPRINASPLGPDPVPGAGGPVSDCNPA
jgi:hypothetical protein